MSEQRIKELKGTIEFLDAVYRKLLKILPSFQVTDRSVLPYGLKPHTRSVSWLVEQVVTQQTKFRRADLGLDEVSFDMPDTSLHDCEIHVKQKKFWVNVKIHNMGGRENKNDISAVEKLYLQYHANPAYDLVYACFGIHFEDVSIRFDADYLRLFSAQFLPIYVNPRNDKIQAFYHHEPQYRTRKEFLALLRSNSKSIVL